MTHAHNDHVKGLPLANKFRIPIYATYEEWKFISVPEDDKDGLVIPGKVCWYGADSGVTVRAFKVHHDAYGPVGYTVEDSDSKVSVCLDTGHVDPDMIEAMKDSDVYIIEANHDPDLVPLCNRPESVKARILSDIGHLSNEQTAVALQQVIRGRGERIYLTHLSGENNNPQLAEMTVKAALRQRGFEAGKHYTIEVI